MTCEQAIERLPWLLNGTLEGEELQEVQHHLETCESCRKALAETRDAWRLFNQHLPSQALVALAYGEVPEGLDAALAERHVASCPQCAAELELARMSRRLEEANNLALFTPKPAQPVRSTAKEYRTWRGAALAASLVGLIAIGGWFQSAQQVRLVPGIQTKQAALEKEMKAQQEQIKRISQPQINVWNQQVHWDEVERGGEETAIVLPVSQPVTPALAADPSISSTERGIDILDEAGKVRWYSTEQLRMNPDTQDFTITFPAGFFAPGKYTFQLYTTENGQKIPRERYTVRVR